MIEVFASKIDGSDLNGKEIYILKGENFNPPWIKTQNGYFSNRVEAIYPGKFVIVSLNKQKDVQATVRATRKITPEPNLSLLNSLIK